MSAVRHRASTRAEAIRMHDAGWSVAAIQRVLGQRGPRPSRSTITMWVHPDAAEKRRVKDRNRRQQIREARGYSYRWPGPPISDAWLLGRMKVLQGIGLSCDDIAKIIGFDHGRKIARDQVRYALQVGHLPRTVRQTA